jgi:hypothetical protein
VRSTTFVRCLSASLLAVGCADPLEAPSAYTGERFLCGSESAAEWNALVSTCVEQNRTERSCRGVTSVRGEHNGESFVADSRLSRAAYQYDAMQPTTLGRTEFAGESPYFKFIWSTEGLKMDRTPGTSLNCLNASTSLFNMEVRGSSNLLRMNFRSCEFAESAGSLDLGFSATFAAGGFLDGCVHMTPAPTHP